MILSWSNMMSVPNFSTLNLLVVAEALNTNHKFEPSGNRVTNVIRIYPGGAVNVSSRVKTLAC